jgi:hypothetical protein
MDTSLRLTESEADVVTVEARTGELLHRLRFTNSPNGWALTEVTTSCADGVSVAAIRSAPLSLARSYLRGERPDVASTVRRPSATGSASTDMREYGEYAAPPSRPPQRRERWDETELAELSARYVALVSDGLGRPTARLAAEYADELGMSSFSSGRMRALLAQARQAGLLSPTKRNTAGGHLTAKAERLLSEVKQ